MTFESEPLTYLPLPRIENHPNPADQFKAVAWAKELLNSDDWVILDTESTGKTASSAHIIQVAVLSPRGELLFNSFVRPGKGVRTQNFVLEDMGVTRDQLKDAPLLEDVILALIPVVGKKRVVSYSADWREELFHWNCHRLAIEKPRWQWVDAMRPYSHYVGEFWKSKGDYKFQALPSLGHESAMNCRETLALINRLAISAPNVKVQAGAIGLIVAAAVIFAILTVGGMIIGAVSNALTPQATQEPNQDPRAKTAEDSSSAAPHHSQKQQTNLQHHKHHRRRH